MMQILFDGMCDILTLMLHSTEISYGSRWEE